MAFSLSSSTKRRGEPTLKALLTLASSGRFEAFAAKSDATFASSAGVPEVV